VYVANGDGRGVQQVTHFQGQEGPPTWASDGRILVAADAGVGADEVYALSPTLNATDATRLTHFTGTRGCPALWGGRDFFGPIAMSVDGRLAFACQAGEIDLLFKNGTRSAAYRPGRSDNTRWTNVYSPAWSPDGAHVAFIEITTDQTADYTMVGLAVKTTDLGGTNVHTVTAVRLNKIAAGQWSGSNNFSLCWMPDGSKLVFNVPESQLVGHIWAVNPDGSGLAQLTFAPGAWDRSVSCAR
jgi:Tol biopolymer transport system component